MLARMGDRWITYWLDCEIVEGPCTRVAAYLAGITGDWSECARLFAAAMGRVESAGRGSLAARMHFELGDLLLRFDREHERARALIAEARDRASSLGLSELTQLIDRRHSAPGAFRASAFSMTLEGEVYAIAASRGTLRFKATRGMRYLAELVARRGTEVHVLELAGAGEGVDRGDAGELLDGRAFAAYRTRLEALREALDEARELGDAERAERLQGEMESIARELSRASGRGGKARRGESAVDRARSAVQRRIKDAIDRIASEDPGLGQFLRASISTGNYCSFRPTP
jgi:hypothetical protein